MPKVYDFTVLHAPTDEDLAWRDWIEWQLEEDGYTVNYTTSISGVLDIKSFEEAIGGSKRFVVVLSKDMLTTTEPTLASFVAGLAGETSQATRQRLVLVKVDKSDTPWFNHYPHRVNLSEHTRGHAELAAQALISAAGAVRSL